MIVKSCGENKAGHWIFSSSENGSLITQYDLSFDKVFSFDVRNEIINFTTSEAEIYYSIGSHVYSVCSNGFNKFLFRLDSEVESMLSSGAYLYVAAKRGSFFRYRIEDGLLDCVKFKDYNVDKIGRMIFKLCPGREKLYITGRSDLLLSFDDDEEVKQIIMPPFKERWILNVLELSGDLFVIGIDSTKPFCGWVKEGKVETVDVTFSSEEVLVACTYGEKVIVGSSKLYSVDKRGEVVEMLHLREYAAGLFLSSHDRTSVDILLRNGDFINMDLD